MEYKLYKFAKCKHKIVQHIIMIICLKGLVIHMSTECYRQPYCYQLLICFYLPALSGAGDFPVFCINKTNQQYKLVNGVCISLTHTVGGGGFVLPSGLVPGNHRILFCKQKVSIDISGVGNLYYIHVQNAVQFSQASTAAKWH